MVERIVRHLKASGALHKAQEAFLVLKDIGTYWENTLLTAQPWKWKLDDTHQQDKIDKIGVAIIDLQERLLHAAKHFQINLHVQVVGDVEDLRHGIGNMIEKMSCLNAHLESITQASELRQQMGELGELNIHSTWF
ncbi:hypothetical protein AC1031_014000 [Aphanomyces cochlioides]|nr:hypothetical protein AC1031_014000 [Aphanomyces cochlioides]